MTPTRPAVTDQTAARPGDPVSRSWVETALAVLNSTSRPLTAREIVGIAQAAGYSIRSRAQTPVRSVNRDLHAAVRRGDTRVVYGPFTGQFCGTAAVVGAELLPAPTKPTRASAVRRLPIQPLAALIEAQGGLAASGVRPHVGDPIDRARWVARLHRAYLRCRRRGWISLHVADELAVNVLSRHPAEIYGEAYWEA